jgi:hypothetical protein
MTGDTSDDGDRRRESDLLDLSNVSLSALVSADHSALDVAIRRHLADIDRATEAISSWSSFADR